MQKKVYFNSYYVALGTSEGLEAYYGEYHTSEVYELAENDLVIGRSAQDLAALSRINVAPPPPPYPDYIMGFVRQKLGLDSSDTSRDAEVANMSKGDVFAKVLEWEGIIGYDYQILIWIRDIYGVNVE